MVGTSRRVVGVLALVPGGVSLRTRPGTFRSLVVATDLPRLEAAAAGEPARAGGFSEWIGSVI